MRFKTNPRRAISPLHVVLERGNNALGRPRHVIFQSWWGPADSRLHEVLINLPEDDPACLATLD